MISKEPVSTNIARGETTKRLLAQTVNEDLVDVFIGHSEKPQICLSKKSSNETSTRRVTVDLARSIYPKNGKLDRLLRPNELATSVTLITATSQTVEDDPGTIFEFMSDWFECSPHTTVQIAHELRNCVSMLGMVVSLRRIRCLTLGKEGWINMSTRQNVCGLNSSFIEWEQSLVFGHPSHPFHRTCFADTLLDPIGPEDLTDLMGPSVSLVNCPSDTVHIFGPFREALKPLLAHLGVADTDPEHIVVPCLSRQLPAILALFPRAEPVQALPCRADAQAAIRTVSIKGVDIDIKFSLACVITSALRVIPCWTARMAPDMTRILKSVAPANLWIFGEIAAVTGAQNEPSEARHLTCILRENFEKKAKSEEEALILGSALIEKPSGSHRTYAEILFDLVTKEQKLEWFVRYITTLLELTLQPLLYHGIGLEAHSQNCVARVCIKTKRIKGFAIRDLAGLRVHGPTLHKQGFDTTNISSIVCTDDIHEVWSRVHHALLQNHIGFMLEALHLEGQGEGWVIVKDVLRGILLSDQNSTGALIFEYFVREKMRFKCFLTMRMNASYQRSWPMYERDIPNLLYSPQL